MPGLFRLFLVDVIAATKPMAESPANPTTALMALREPLGQSRCDTIGRVPGQPVK